MTLQKFASALYRMDHFILWSVLSFFRRYAFFDNSVALEWRLSKVSYVVVVLECSIGPPKACVLAITSAGSGHICQKWGQTVMITQASIGSTSSRKRIPASLSQAAKMQTSIRWLRGAGTGLSHANTMVLDAARFYTPLLSRG